MGREEQITVKGLFPFITVIFVSLSLDVQTEELPSVWRIYFSKRKKLQMKINNYNTSCILAWRANMDIQFVLDVYACAMYIVSYISKAQRGISDLLRTACEEAKLGNSTVHQQVRDIGGKFLNAVEISAQEAVYIALQLPMRRSSRGSYIC